MLRDEKKIVAIAKICHEVNKVYCESLGDESQVLWNEAEDWQRESAVDGVKFQVANIDAPASASHENWLKMKEKEGWKFGKKKNPKKKIHPCMVPFEELPAEQQTKDHLFKRVVRSMVDSILLNVQV